MTSLGGFSASLPEVGSNHLQSYVKCALGHKKSKICHLIFTKNKARHFYFGLLFKEKPQIAERVSVESFFNHLCILRHIWPSKSILKLPTDFLGIMSFRVDDRRNKYSAGLRHCLAIPKEMPLWSPQGNPQSPFYRIRKILLFPRMTEREKDRLGEVGCVAPRLRQRENDSAQASGGREASKRLL